MTAGNIRDWLGKYFLLVTVIVGGYILLFGGKYSRLLPISPETASSTIQILVPTFVAQLLVMFQYWGDAKNQDDETVVSLRPWIVKWPPILVLMILVITVLLMAVGLGQGWAPGEADFSKVVTFCVTVLNSTTVFILTRFFGGKKPAEATGTGIPDATVAATPTAHDDAPSPTSTD